LPALLTPDSVYEHKRRAYEQLETGCHYPNREEWFEMTEKHKQSEWKPYFKTPPELTSRQKELYGLQRYKECALEVAEEEMPSLLCQQKDDKYLDPCHEECDYKLRIVIVRHGSRGGGPDPELFAKGHQQAAALASCLAADYRDLKAMYSSPFIRCLQTARPIADKCDLQLLVDYGLCEFLSPWLHKGNPLPDLAYAQPDFKDRADVPQGIVDWDYVSSPKPTFPDCPHMPKTDEDRKCCLERHQAVLTAIQHKHAAEGGTVIVVGHGATHDFLVDAACPPIAKQYRTPFCVPNCSMTTLLLATDGKWKLKGFGEQVIPRELRTHH